MATALDFAKGSTTCRVDRDQALSFLGHTGQDINAELKARLETMAKRCEEENAPRYLWRTFDLDRTGEAPTATTAQGPLVFPGKAIETHLAGAQRVTLLAVTLGAAWQQTLAQLTATSPTDALLYDACANAATEAAANDAHDVLVSAARAFDLEARARFSPGYSDLPLDLHPAFLAALDAPRMIGVFATPSKLLTPAKSITAVVGLFEPQSCIASAPPSDLDAQCTSCAALTYCTFRERGTTCHG